MQRYYFFLNYKQFRQLFYKKIQNNTIFLLNSDKSAYLCMLLAHYIYKTSGISHQKAMPPLGVDKK